MKAYQITYYVINRINKTVDKYFSTEETTYNTIEAFADSIANRISSNKFTFVDTDRIANGTVFQRTGFLSDDIVKFQVDAIINPCEEDQ